jgi:hypothetical protein
MTELLQKAFAEAAKLPETEQDAIAALMLQELESERRWQEAIAHSPEKLSRLAQEALEEQRMGKTRPLDETLDSEDD